MCDLLICQDLMLSCDQPSKGLSNFFEIDILTPFSIDAFHIDDKFDGPLVPIHTLFMLIEEDRN